MYTILVKKLYYFDSEPIEQGLSKEKCNNNNTSPPIWAMLKSDLLISMEKEMSLMKWKGP